MFVNFAVFEIRAISAFWLYTTRLYQFGDCAFAVSRDPYVVGEI